MGEASITIVFPEGTADPMKFLEEVIAPHVCWYVTPKTETVTWSDQNGNHSNGTK